MKSKVVIAVLMTVVAGAAGAHEAVSSSGASNSAPSTLSTNLQLALPINHPGSFGLGPLLGEPTGLGAKVWLSDKTAIDAGAGWSFEGRDGFQLHADFLFHVLDLVHFERGQLPLYLGVGGRVKFVEHADNRAGLRFPVGVAYLFPDAPLEVFAEVAPIIDFAPGVQLQWNGGIGLRYYFR